MFFRWYFLDKFGTISMIIEHVRFIFHFRIPQAYDHIKDPFHSQTPYPHRRCVQNVEFYAISKATGEAAPPRTPYVNMEEEGGNNTPLPSHYIMGVLRPNPDDSLSRTFWPRRLCGDEVWG